MTERKVEYQATASEQGKEQAIFTKDMTIMEALQADPRARDIFEAHGIDCVGCSGIVLESIADGAKTQGFDLDEVLEDLNKLAAAGSSQE